MQPKPTIIATIAASAFFAIAIVLCDRMTEGTQWNQTVTYSLIALWFVPFSLLMGTCKPSKKRLSAIKE